MEPLTVHCPQCKTLLKIPAASAGKKIGCPKCKTQFALKPPAAPARPVAPPARVATPPTRAPAPPARAAAPPARPATPRPAPPAEEPMNEMFAELAPVDDAEDTEAAALVMARSRQPGSKSGKKLPLPLPLFIGGGVGLLVLIGVGVFFVMRGQSKPAQTPPVQRAPPTVNQRQTWTADATLLGELDQETPMPGNATLRFRPPKGFMQQQLQLPMGQTVVWVGQPRPDASATTLIVAVIPVPSGEIDENNPQAFFAGMTSTMRAQGIQDWQESPPELGQVSGLTFARIRWSGTIPQLNQKMKGFVYMTVQGQSVISIAGQDSEPHEAQTLKLLDAAALSCRSASP